MVDVFTRKKRSEIMARIRSCDTVPEKLLRMHLTGLYLRQQPKIYGKPDFANKAKMIAVFVDGCFWHKCPVCYREPKTNMEYWIPKLDRNVRRDRKTNMILRKNGWRIFRVWEHEVRANPKKAAVKITAKLPQNLRSR